MEFKQTPFTELTEFSRKPFVDHRGVFQRVYDLDLFSKFLGEQKLVQINHSMTREVGSVRGLHLQVPPLQEIKVVQCLKGRVLDVVVDLRKSSKTFLKSFTVELEESKANGLIIPKGFAHGFQVLEPDSELLYFHTAPYSKPHEFGFNIRAPKFNIQLPLPIQNISEKDESYMFIEDSFQGY